jgi:4-hydroxy-3-methylbut-2-en-1-yl diphosphate reductase
MKIEIDKKSGFCFGVTNAIQKAEEELKLNKPLFCLGDIVHNDAEISRLSGLGLVTISRSRFFTLSDCKVLIRAHGEPPETYEYAEKNNITLIDATCPVVLKLQKRVKTSYKNIAGEGGQLVIFGKPGHAETEGINGQTGNRAIIIQTKEELAKVDFSKPVELYSQTTMPIARFAELSGLIKQISGNNKKVLIHDTICRQVANRGPYLRDFASRFDIVIFVSGRKSSNGAALFQICREANAKTFFVENADDLKTEWFNEAQTAGICGATSTPMWLMEQVARWIEDQIRS